jgi:hypothetical protein
MKSNTTTSESAARGNSIIEKLFRESGINEIIFTPEEKNYVDLFWTWKGSTNVGEIKMRYHKLDDYSSTLIDVGKFDKLIKYVELGLKVYYIVIWEDFIEFYPIHQCFSTIYKLETIERRGNRTTEFESGKILKIEKMLPRDIRSKLVKRENAQLYLP